MSVKVKIFSLLKIIRYFFELLAIKLGLFIFNIIGVKNASNFGSFLARKVGKLISVNKLATNNITKAFPKLTKSQVNQIVDDMWDNLGRIAGEFVHCCKFNSNKPANHLTSSAKTLSNIDEIKKSKRGGIFFSGHIGNWEIGPQFFLKQGLNVKVVYRPLNNIGVDKLTSQSRNIELIPKTSKGSKQIISEIKKGNYVLILVDQKISEGIEVPFFHDKALTSSSVARLALKYDVPLIPVRAIRIGREFKFKVEIESPIKLSKTKKTLEDQILDLMTKVNKKIESWVKEYPHQWFWVHNRWKK
jgi:KDO2-lipid IV(A) lauroyltransferase